MNIISKRIKFAREYRGIKQRALAPLCGITPSALCQFERGRNAPKRKTLVAICQALNVSSDFLFGLVPTQKDIFALVSVNPKISPDMAEAVLCRAEMEQEQGREE